MNIPGNESKFFSVKILKSWDFQFTITILMLKMNEKLDSCCKKIGTLFRRYFISDPYKVKMQTSSLKISR